MGYFEINCKKQLLQNHNVLHTLRKMLSFRSQICISTICGLISIATAQLGAGCPEAYGVQTYPDEKYCDRFYKCTNGTLTEEICENGLVYDGYGNIHNHCNYNWAVDCGGGPESKDLLVSMMIPQSHHQDVFTLMVSTQLEKDAKLPFSNVQLE